MPVTYKVLTRRTSRLGRSQVGCESHLGVCQEDVGDEVYNHKTSGDPSVLNCPHTDTEDDHPIFCKEVEAAVQSLKKGKSAGVDNIPTELVQAGGESSGAPATLAVKG